ncbi:P-loop containing nucleoside triphosphate hydrolase protein [Pelagophyceae sp. CCMP2097]|nr:P-loop containing nucleoside triphosphate hydrolase protein [Pelagophyceae sp. CCMP2097]
MEVFPLPVAPGRVLAITGPSGAGKTTLINVLTLSAFGGVSRGLVTLGGRAMTQKLFSRKCFVVPQYDTHWAFLTLRETLQYAAELYLSGVGAVERADAIDAIEKKMGLVSCSNTIVGNEFKQGLSGGQKRRLSIACRAAVAGLDAAAAANIMVFIRELAERERLCVVATIHQPSTKVRIAFVVYEGFDQVMVLASGRIAYCGAAGEAVNAYLAAIGEAVPQFTNPAEFVLDLVNADFQAIGQEGKVHLLAILETWRVRGHEWSGSEAVKADAAEAKALSAEPESSSRGVALGAQVSVMLRRHTLLSLRDPALYIGRALVILIGNIYFSLVLNRLWLCVWLIGVPANLGVVVVIALNSEFKSIKREIQNGMCSPVAYLVAKSCIELPFFVLFAICGLCAAALLAVSFDNPLLGMMNFMGVWFSGFLYGGFLIAGKDMVWPLKIFYYVMPLRYGVRSMVQTEFASRDFHRYRACVAKGGACYGKKGTDVLHAVHLTSYPNFDSKSTYVDDIVALVVLALGFKLFYLLTSYRKSRKASTILPPIEDAH